jgi:hypothetical protein
MTKFDYIWQLIEYLGQVYTDNFRDKTGHKAKTSPLQKPSGIKMNFFSKLYQRGRGIAQW